MYLNCDLKTFDLYTLESKFDVDSPHGLKQALGYHYCMGLLLLRFLGCGMLYGIFLYHI